MILAASFAVQTCTAQLADGTGVSTVTKDTRMATTVFFGASQNMEVETREFGKTNLDNSFVGYGVTAYPGLDLLSHSLLFTYERSNPSQEDEETAETGQFVERFYVSFVKFPEPEARFGYAVSLGWSRVDLWEPIRDRHLDSGFYSGGRIFYDTMLSESAVLRFNIFLSSKLNGTDTANNIGIGGAVIIPVYKGISLQGGIQGSITQFRFSFHGNIKSTVDTDETRVNEYSSEFCIFAGLNASF